MGWEESAGRKGGAGGWLQTCVRAHSHPVLNEARLRGRRILAFHQTWVLIQTRTLSPHAQGTRVWSHGHLGPVETSDTRHGQAGTGH